MCGGGADCVALVKIYISYVSSHHIRFGSLCRNNWWFSFAAHPQPVLTLQVNIVYFTHTQYPIRSRCETTSFGTWIAHHIHHHHHIIMNRYLVELSVMRHLTKCKLIWNGMKCIRRTRDHGVRLSTGVRRSGDTTTQRAPGTHVLVVSPPQEMKFM